MMWNNPYNPNTSIEAGGFFPNSQQTGNSQVAEATLNFPSAGGDSGGKNVTSVSISQIVNRTRKEEGLIIEQQKIEKVSVVGLVLSVQEQSTKATFLLDDHSDGSPTNVQLWNSDESGNRLPIMERSYMEVIGHARYLDNEPFIVALQVRPILDINEITLHHISVIRDWMYLEKRKAFTKDPPESSMQVDQNGSRAEAGDGQNYDYIQSGGFSKIQKAVLTTVMNCKEGAGIKKAAVVASLKNTFNSKDVIQTLEFLSNEGHIFTTVDDETFKSTDSTDIM